MFSLILMLWLEVDKLFFSWNPTFHVLSLS